ncbi:MAG: XTP/dITP diphosphatase [Nitrospirae bacterium]|nr:XTP/dITP diphosphatase [Nitrospirota bacterium]
MELLLATENEGKIREIKEMLKGLNINILLLKDFPGLPKIKEEGATFRENAIHKAKEFSELTGKISLADDSGLEVEALGNKPGVYSARFAGEEASDEENNCKLLKLLGDLPLARRKARFRCVMAIVDPQGRIEVTEGKCSGLIGFKPQGEFGFGYDSLFIIPDYNRTFGQLSPSIKNELSHRSQALKKMRKVLEEMIEGVDKDAVGK